MAYRKNCVGTQKQVLICHGERSIEVWAIVSSKSAVWAGGQHFLQRMHVRSLKTSAQSVQSYRVLCRYPRIYADSKDPHQTARMRLLIWVFAGRTCGLVETAVSRLKCSVSIIHFQTFCFVVLLPFSQIFCPYHTFAFYFILVYYSLLIFNPFMPKGPFYLKPLGWSISFVKNVWLVFIIIMLYRSSLFNANSADPDQTPHSLASDLSLHC